MRLGRHGKVCAEWLGVLGCVRLRQGRFGLFRQGSVRFVALWFCMVSFGRYGVACHGELSSVSVVFVKASLGFGRLGDVWCVDVLCV